MSEVPSQRELDIIPPIRQEQLDDFRRCLDVVSGQLLAYDKVVDSGAELSPGIYEDIEDLLVLEDYYKRMLDL